MQNFFLSPAVRLRVENKAPTAAEVAAQALLSTGIPAAQVHGIRVIWLCRGLTEHDLKYYTARSYAHIWELRYGAAGGFLE
jgi:hypothetical protein